MTLLFLLMSITSHATIKTGQIVQQTAENQIKNLIEPLLEKYCKDACRLLSIRATVDGGSSAASPGFEDADSNALEASAGQVKLLVDKRLSSSSQKKLIELLQQYLDSLEFPVTITTQSIQFPIPAGSGIQTAELKSKLLHDISAQADEFAHSICNDHCSITGITLNAEAQNDLFGESSNTTTLESSALLSDPSGAHIKITEITATLLLDEALSSQDQSSVIEMAKSKLGSFGPVTLTTKRLPFPDIARKGRSIASLGTDSRSSQTDNKQTSDNKSDSKSDSKYDSKSDSKSTETSNRHERVERFEKIERVENGDAVQAELKKFKIFGIIFAGSVMLMLFFIALMMLTNRKTQSREITYENKSPFNEPYQQPAAIKSDTTTNPSFMKRYEIERLTDELACIFSEQPKVSKHVFSRIITEEGVETTAEYISLFGESIMIEMLRDASLQTDLAELMEFYSKNTIILSEEEKFELLQKLHNRTTAAKLLVLGSRSSALYDFLSEMNADQIAELIRTESLTVKAIVLTQCDAQKRSLIFSHLEPSFRLSLLTELSRIDHLPREYIMNVAHALRRKKKENPKMNTESLPGSEVLVSLLEKTSSEMQKSVIDLLESTHPENAKTLMSKLVSTETLRYMRDAQLLEVVLSLKHEELIQFLKGSTDSMRQNIFAKAPRELVIELEEELTLVSTLSRDTYQAIERKVLNKLKIMANEGTFNLLETNERMFADMKSTKSMNDAAYFSGVSL